MAPILFLFFSIYLVIAPTTAGPLVRHANNSSDPAVRLLYQYPTGTLIENIAVRPSGELLLTLLTSPTLDQLDPFAPTPQPKTIHTFAGSSGVTGIAEIAPDSFAVAAGNFSFTSGGVRDSWGMWKVAFASAPVEVSKIVDLPGARMPNGMSRLPSSWLRPQSRHRQQQLPSEDNVMLSDAQEGNIRFVSTSAANVSVTIANNLTALNPNPLLGTSGVNGIHVAGPTSPNDTTATLYFSSSSLNILAKLPIHATNGTPAAPPEVLHHEPQPLTVFNYDDFALRDDAVYAVTGVGNSVQRIIDTVGAPTAEIIAGGLNSTLIAGPTSCAFGRTHSDAHVLYVVTSGALLAPVNGSAVVGAQVLAVDTRASLRRDQEV